jgi:hypothetical protein
MKLKRKLLEGKTSELQKRLVKYLDPEHVLELEEHLKEIIQVERVAIKAAQRLNIRPAQLQAAADDLLEIIQLLQI